MLANSPIVWVGFNVFLLVMLALDLLVFHRRPHAVRLREALLWSAMWIALAFVFALGLWLRHGSEPALEFVTAYVIEESLSVDNLFVFLLVFSFFRVPPDLQHRVLFWGILGAMVMRLGFILAGVALLERFHWVLYIFGSILVLSGARLWSQKDVEVHPERNPVLRLVRRFWRVTPTFEGARFFVVRQGQRFATPLFVTLLVLETTDLVFAVDSIPAVLGVTRDPFIAYSSNAFAVLGLRALYFALAGAMRLFHHLHYGLSAILVFVGLKMLIADIWPIPTVAALAFVAAILVVSVVGSVLLPRRGAAHGEDAPKPADGGANGG